MCVGDLYLGMTVKESDLSKICSIYFILINTKVLENGVDIEGELAYFGNGKGAEYRKWFMQDQPITPLYFCKEDAEDDIINDG